MIKKICFVLSIIFIFSLVSCDPATYYFDADELTENTVKIVLVKCKNDDPKKINVEGNITPDEFDFNNVEIIKKLEKEKFKEFATDLSKIVFHLENENESVNAPLGYAVLIYMKDQKVIILSSTVANGTAYSMVATFSTDGEFINHIANFADRPSFEKLLEKYFGVN